MVVRWWTAHARASNPWFTSVACRQPFPAGLLLLLLAALSLSCAWQSRLQEDGEQSGLPRATVFRRGQLEIYCDFSLPRDHPLIAQLLWQRAELERILAIRLGTQPIKIFLFSDRDRYLNYIQRHYPELPDRRAFFFETGNELAVIASWGPRVGEDLRHEVTHAYLRTAMDQLPLWLDEGLAEYFEVGTAEGLHLSHLDLLLHRIDRGWLPDMQRLETLESSADLSRLDYAESWAWTHWMLQSTVARRELFQAHLQRLSRDGVPLPLAVALRNQEADPLTALVSHLRIRHAE